MEEKELSKISKKLDILIIISLARSGISQREIGKILGMSTKTIVGIFGKNYEKLQNNSNSGKIL